MGSKTAARAAMRAAGVPIIPGTTDPVETVDEVLAPRRRGRLPADRQGRGRRRRQGDEARRARPTRPSARSSRRSARARRTSPTPRLRRALPRGPAPRRGAGARRRARERDPPRRARLHDPAPPPEAGRGDAVARRRRRAARADRRGSPSTPRGPSATARPGRSRGCSTADGDYYFMEMNTRIQVEHTVTEMVTGLDLVREQVLIAAGEPLSVRQEDVRLRGHAIECRINAEDVVERLPAGARDGSRATASRRARASASTRASWPARRSRGLYDPMIAKLIVHGVDREHARLRMLRALDEFEIGGVADAARLPPRAARAPVLRRGRDVSRRRRVGGAGGASGASCRASTTAAAAASDGRSCARARPRSRSTAAASTCACSSPSRRGPSWRARRRERAARGPRRRRARRGRQPDAGHRARRSRSPRATRSSAGQVICVVEAMKMENEIAAHRPGIVAGALRRAGRRRSRPAR